MCAHREERVLPCWAAITKDPPLVSSGSVLSSRCLLLGGSMVYVIPSSPVEPVSFSGPQECEVVEETSIASLAKRVSSYLARVVGALADFEDRLLTEDGFFAREEHFEAQIESLRREFEGNKKATVRPRPTQAHTTSTHPPEAIDVTALGDWLTLCARVCVHVCACVSPQSLFSRSDTVGLLIAQLIANPSGAGASSELHSRRQQQFVFAASVLLTSSTILRTLRNSPALLDRMWAFVVRPAPLDSVQLQYWCRVVGTLLLHSPDANHPSTAAAVAPLLPRLLRHVYSDSVCVLIKCLLGLPLGSPMPGGADSPVSSPVGGLHAGAPAAGGAGAVSMLTALSGEHSVLTPCVDLVLEGGEGAANAAELPCTLCATLPDRADALELRAAFVHSFTPLLARVYEAALGPDAIPAEARIGALKVAAAALNLEHRCTALMAEQDAWLPTTLLQPDATETAAEGAGGAMPHPSPFAQLLAPRLDALAARLINSKSLVQLQLAELLATVMQTAPAWLREPICDAGLLSAAVSLFLRPDSNGGGRQDFVRHILLRGLRSTLETRDAPRLHHALIVGSGLPLAMLRALNSTRLSAPPREYVRLLYLELGQASECDSSIRELLSGCGREWIDLGKAIVRGVANKPDSAPASPVPLAWSSPTRATPMDAAAPAELVYVEPDAEVDAQEADASTALPPSLGAQPEAVAIGEETSAADDADEPHDVCDGDSAKVDAENIDPNSPPSTKRARSRPIGACGTPRPRMSPFDASASQEVGMASLAPPPPHSPPPPMHSPSDGEVRQAGDVHPGTPRPDAGIPVPHPDTPRPADSPDPRGSNASLRFVEDSTLRSSEDFSRDTPQPKLVRRAYLHRKAKENFGARTPGDSPGASPGASPGSSPGASPKDSPGAGSKRSVPNLVVGFQIRGKENDQEAADAVDAAEEDGDLTQLRSSVRSLCFN